VNSLGWPRQSAIRDFNNDLGSTVLVQPCQRLLTLLDSAACPNPFVLDADQRLKAHQDILKDEFSVPVGLSGYSPLIPLR
jgi:hypothetical protein